MIKRDSKVIKLNQPRGILGVDRRIMTLAIVAAVIIALGLIFLPNAYKISMNGEFIGAIKDKKIIEGAKETVITQLQNVYGTEVQFEEELQVERYRAKKRDYIDPSYLISSMRKKMGILIGFKEVFVEGESIGIVASEEDVETLKNELKKKYYGSADIKVEFGKKVEIKDVFAKEDDLVAMDKLVQKCAATTPKSIQYTVQAGDTLSGIASRYNTTMESIISANEGFTKQTVLRVGQTINANINEAYLPLEVVQSVQTEQKIEEEKTQVDESSSSDAKGEHNA